MILGEDKIVKRCSFRHSNNRSVSRSETSKRLAPHKNPFA
jgi:hypothetical protein